MSDVTITFTVPSNQALLLLTCHDLISGVVPDDSVVGVYHFDWLLDELRIAAENYRDFVKHEAAE